MLARPDAHRLLVGAGALAAALTHAHTTTHTYAKLAVWTRDAAKAAQFAQARRNEGLAIDVAVDLSAAVAAADVIVTATTATLPIVRCERVQPGTHLSLMGAFTRTMVEVEPALLADVRLFADTRVSVLAKGGEVTQAIAAGFIDERAIEADLFELVAPGHEVHRSRDEITVFKSVGSAAFDLVAAELVLGGAPR